MRFILSAIFCSLLCSSMKGQTTGIKWYSETTSNGLTIQNSFPKGGPYRGQVKKHFNYSHLVFFSRVVNETATPVEFEIHFPTDSIPIPGSADIFMKLLLPPDTMTLDKQILFGYGISELKSLEGPTKFQRTINPKGECFFYVVAIFYQTTAIAQNWNRGGNRAELILKGEELFYSMPPQLESLSCGHIRFKSE